MSFVLYPSSASTSSTSFSCPSSPSSFEWKSRRPLINSFDSCFEASVFEPQASSNNFSSAADVYSYSSASRVSLQLSPSTSLLRFCLQQLLRVQEPSTSRPHLFESAATASSGGKALDLSTPLLRSPLQQPSNAESSSLPPLRQPHPCPGFSAVKKKVSLRRKKTNTTLVRVVDPCFLLFSQTDRRLNSLLNLRTTQDQSHLTVPFEHLAWVEVPHAPLRLHKW